MNTVTFKPRIASPYQHVAKKHPFDISSVNHPVRKEILKNVGNIALSIYFSEDLETIAMLKIPGLIAFVCRIEQNGKTVGIGRANAILSENSKYFDRIIQSSSNYALVDAVSKMTRTVASLNISSHTNSNFRASDREEILEEAYQVKDSRDDEMMSPKQREYLLQLIHTNIRNEDERSLRCSQMSDFTKAEASRAIASFQK